MGILLFKETQVQRTRCGKVFCDIMEGHRVQVKSKEIIEDSLVTGISFWCRGLDLDAIVWSVPTKENDTDYSKSIGFRLKARKSWKTRSIRRMKYGTFHDKAQYGIHVAIDSPFAKWNDRGFRLKVRLKDE